MRKWLVVSSHDERNDFNLEMRIFEGTVIEFEDSIYSLGLTRNDLDSHVDGVYYYHKERRSNECCSNIDDEDWEVLKEKLEVISFDTVILIPLEKIIFDDFYLYHPIVNRNIKFGFLDIKGE